ncbi:unnamed protein product [Miscanthus lutarioriparius]|uniref:Uncharacterized protein n=1 Tax=Miscanthus lutarioriparius TaxID=422564 RepID=A0A811NB16_9POAL|nr:unnamed protein product [Miscanthus lutarioriparius]
MQPFAPWLPAFRLLFLALYSTDQASHLGLLQIPETSRLATEPIRRTPHKHTTLPRSYHSTMTFVLVGQDDSSSSEAAAAGDLGSSTVDLPHLSSIGHYLPAAAVTGVCALHWLPFAAAVAAALALLGASHEDLRLRAHQLSHELTGAFAAAAVRPFAAVCGATARFPEDGLYVCADLPPLAPALLDVQRALTHVAAKEASHAVYDWYFDAVDLVMRLLVDGDAGDGRGPAVFDSSKFELVFALKWVD